MTWTGYGPGGPDELDAPPRPPKHNPVRHNAAVLAALRTMRHPAVTPDLRVGQRVTHRTIGLGDVSHIDPITGIVTVVYDRTGGAGHYHPHTAAAILTGAPN